MTSKDQYSAVVHGASEIVVLGAFGIKAIAELKHINSKLKPAKYYCHVEVISTPCADAHENSAFGEMMAILENPEVSHGLDDLLAHIRCIDGDEVINDNPFYRYLIVAGDVGLQIMNGTTEPNLIHANLVQQGSESRPCLEAITTKAWVPPWTLSDIEAVALIIQNRISLVISESKRLNDTYIQNNQLGALRR